MTGLCDPLKWARDVRAAYGTGLPVPDGALLEAHRALAAAGDERERERAADMVVLLEGEGIGRKPGGCDVYGNE